MTQCQHNAIGHCCSAAKKDEFAGYVPPAAGTTGRSLFISTTTPPISASAGHDATSRHHQANHAHCHQRKSPMLFHVSSAIGHYIAVVDSPPSNAVSPSISSNPRDDEFTADFFKGFATIACITLLYASLSPLWHAVFQGDNPPRPLFLNAAVSVVALVGILLGAPCLDDMVGKPSLAPPSPTSAGNNVSTRWSLYSFRGSIELGFWKCLGTTAHIFGMSLITVNHGAFFFCK